MKTTIACLLLALTPAFTFGTPPDRKKPAPAPEAPAKGKKPYPLKVCIVTDNTLGSMGPVRTLTHNGQEVKFCCKPCVGKFKKNPEKYLSKLK